MTTIQAPACPAAAVRGSGQLSRADVRSATDATPLPEQLRVRNRWSAL
jgi:hypothetical protein